MFVIFWIRLAPILDRFWPILGQKHGLFWRSRKSSFSKSNPFDIGHFVNQFQSDFHRFCTDFDRFRAQNHIWRYWISLFSKIYIFHMHMGLIFVPKMILIWKGSWALDLQFISKCGLLCAQVFRHISGQFQLIFGHFRFMSNCHITQRYAERRSQNVSANASAAQ